MSDLATIGIVWASILVMTLVWWTKWSDKD